MEHQSVCWQGLSGREYKYWIYPMATTFSEEPGNYIFASQNSQNRLTPLYIGETGDLKTRLSDHEKLTCVKTHGGNVICVHKSSDSKDARVAEETDVRGKWKTSCNDQ